MAKIIINAENEVRGRVASRAAKEALAGNEVVILNSEKALISGRAAEIIADFKVLRAMNTIKPKQGPFASRDSEKMMKRTIRGMLPDYRVGRGSVALKLIKCYNGIPNEFKDAKTLKLDTKTPKRHMTIGDLSRRC
jgi:large subunit ribosomal protein L13